jgi:hypothetical protein
VRAEWIVRLGGDGTGIALIGHGDDLQPYKITENVCTLPDFDGPQLVGYRLEKADGTVYDVGTLTPEPTCDCPGFVRWHGERGTRCKHLKGLAILVGLCPADADLPEPSGQCFPDDLPEFPF